MASSFSNNTKISAGSVLKQSVNTLSIGQLTEDMIRILAAGISEKLGTSVLTNPYRFIDPTTKVIGKYGFTVNTLRSQRYVYPETYFNGELENQRRWRGKDGIRDLDDFYFAEAIQDKILLTEIFSLYEDLQLANAIQSSDSPSVIAGMVMVGKALGGNVKQAVEFREGKIITALNPQTTMIVDAVNTRKELITWFYLGDAAVKQVNTKDGLGYSNKFYKLLTAEAAKSNW
jgi:hypothetical protein